MSDVRFICKYESPLGWMTMASDGECLTGLWFDGQKYDKANLQGRIVDEITEEEKVPVFIETCKWLNLYFGKISFDGREEFSSSASVEPDFTPPLKVEGSSFRQMIAEILLTIPYGQTMTYGEIGKIAAERLGKKTMSAQAVGGAVGHNPISLIIPCHRVVGSDGSLTGYAGGIDKKRALLELESQLGKQEKSL